MEWWRNLKERVIVNRYAYYGLICGDIWSYIGHGGPSHAGWYEYMFNFWEKQYIKLGYTPIPYDKLIISGGFGAPHEHLLRIKDESGSN